MPSSSYSRVGHILVCGGGLAAQMVVTALSRQLPASVAITWAKSAPPETDIFYGNVTSPAAYEFNLSLGVEETALVLNSSTAFSFGTEYIRWGGHTWVQGFQQPMPVLGGVLLHHYLSSQNITGLEPFLVSAVAGRMGRFAHPPETGDHPLVKAEYGYQLDQSSYAALFAAAADLSHLTIIDAEVAGADTDDAGLKAVRLSDGQTLSADLYIDCTGPQAHLLSALPGDFKAQRPIHAVVSHSPADKLGPAVRRLTAYDFGWQSDTPIQGGSVRMTVSAPTEAAAVQAAHGHEAKTTAEIVTGRQDQAWRGNCVAIGHAAAVAEPLSPAPFILLQQDIERLLSLLPFDTHDMSVERRDFNRLFSNHFDHAQLFNAAFFELETLPSTAYWQAGRALTADPLLTRKSEQFSSRGLYVSYDDELFNREDWITLYYGLRRVPARHDHTAERANSAKIKAHLINLQNQIEMAVKAVPPHDTYMQGLHQYLSKKTT